MKISFSLNVSLWIASAALLLAAIGGDMARAQTIQEPQQAQGFAEPTAASARTAAAEPAATAAVSAAEPATGEVAPSNTEPTIDVSAYLAESDASAVDTNTPSLRIYGFADFTAAYMKVGDVDTTAFNGENPQMYLGNLNVYLDGDLTNRFRSLAEIRFTYLPNGTVDVASIKRVSTTSTDYAAFGLPLNWGGIQIERAWLEYSAHSLFNVRVGQFLTPVGIWNVDHGTPTIIPVARPYVIGAGLFPTRQTGFEIYGSTLLAEDTTLGYHLTLSNGRGNADSYLDFDANKALGARLYITFAQLGNLTLGLSGYRGRATNAGVTAISKDGGISLANSITYQYDELSYAADLLWTYQGLHLQAELFGNDVGFTDEGRPKPAFMPGAGKVPDYRRGGGYGLLGYRFSWLSLMPHVLVEYLKNGETVALDPVANRRAMVFGIGLNARPVASVTLKLGGYIGKLRSLVADSVYRQIMLQAAWSF